MQRLIILVSRIGVSTFLVNGACCICVTLLKSQLESPGNPDSLEDLRVGPSPRRAVLPWLILHVAIYTTFVDGWEAQALVEMRHSLVKTRHLIVIPGKDAFDGNN